MLTLLHVFVLSVTFVFCSNLTFANSESLTTCPSMRDVKISHLALTMPYEHDAKTKSLKIFTIAEYLTETNEAFDFLIYPVQVAFGETLMSNINTLVSQLQTDSEIPLTYQINDEYGSVSVCSYSIPGNANVTALLIADDGDMESDRDFSSKKEHKTRIRQLLMKQLSV